MNEHITEIGIDRLEYDPHNNRLPIDMRGASQSEIEKYLGDAQITDQLVGSIATNGLLKSMPILVTPLPTGKFRVKDGNRRLVAVRAFTAETVPNWVRGRFRDALQNSGFRSTTMYAHIAETEEEARDLIGAIHIEPTLRWEIDSRLRYIKEMFDRTEGESLKARLSTVALRVGVDSRFVLKSINVTALHDYAVERNFFGVKHESNFFSIFPLWNAMNSTSLMKFIGVRRNDSIVCLGENINHINHDNLAELWFYLYGEMREGGNFISGRDSSFEKLGAIVDCYAALEDLREYQNLDRAYRKTSESYESFRNFMSEAMMYLRRARRYAEGMTYEAEGAGHLIAEAETELFHTAQAVTKAKFSVTDPE